MAASCYCIDGYLLYLHCRCIHSGRWLPLSWYWPFPSAVVRHYPSANISNSHSHRPHAAWRWYSPGHVSASLMFAPQSVVVHLCPIAIPSNAGTCAVRPVCVQEWAMAVFAPAYQCRKPELVARFNIGGDRILYNMGHLVGGSPDRVDESGAPGTLFFRSWSTSSSGGLSARDWEAPQFCGLYPSQRCVCFCFCFPRSSAGLLGPRLDSRHSTEGRACVRLKLAFRTTAQPHKSRLYLTVLIVKPVIQGVLRGS